MYMCVHVSMYVYVHVHTSMYMYVNIYMDVRLGLYLSFSYNVFVCRLHPLIFFRKTMSESSFKFVGLSVLSVCLSVLWQPYCPTVLNKPIRLYNIVVLKKCLVVYRRRHNTNCAAPKTYSTPPYRQNHVSDWAKNLTVSAQGSSIQYHWSVYSISTPSPRYGG